jgi:hypothetical protein
MNDINAITAVETFYNIELVRVSSSEYRSVNGCPHCGDGGKGSRSDRFRLFLEGSPLVWCRRCGFTAFVDSIDGSEKPSSEQIQEARLRQLERRQEEQEKRLSALEYMAHCTDWRAYHNAMGERNREYWYGEGIYDDAIRDFSLGYCAQCPTDSERRPSYTIPVWGNGILRNIRHRLVGAANGDKYRPHRAGLGAMLFNIDALQKSDRAIIWEGEKKTIVMAQHLAGFANVGTMGKRVWKREWSAQFTGKRDVIVALDPDAMDSAQSLGKLLADAGARSVRVAMFPVKPDDAVNLYAATAQDIEYILMTARIA